MGMNDEMERMLEVFTEWLNKWQEAEQSDYRIERSNYDECDDPPRLLNRSIILPGTIYERYIVTVICNPLHDEGGPNILTGFFNPEGDLETVIQYFDTMDSAFYINGAFDPAALPEED